MARVKAREQKQERERERERARVRELELEDERVLGRVRDERDGIGRGSRGEGREGNIELPKAGGEGE